MFVVLPLLSGCGGGIDRVKMSGDVTYAGQPVKVGQIRFTPLPGVEMPLTIALIKDGRYNTSSNGGLPVGSFQVVIFSYHPDDPEPSGPGARPRRQLLPAKYNTRSELKITVEKGGEQVHDFNLPR